MQDPGFRLGPKKLVGKDLKEYYRKEIKRVEEAINDAKSRLLPLSTGVIALSKQQKKAELEAAIHIGELYFAKLKERYKNI